MGKWGRGNRRGGADNLVSVSEQLAELTAIGTTLASNRYGGKPDRCHISDATQRPPSASPQSAECRVQSAERRLQTADCRLQTARH